MGKSIDVAGMALFICSLIISPLVIFAADENPDYVKEGVNAFKAENYEDALTNFQAARKEDPNKTDLFYYLGSCFYKLEKYPEALENFYQGEKEKPEAEDHIFMYYRALSEYKSQLYLSSKQRLETIIKKYPKSKFVESCQEFIKDINKFFRENKTTENNLNWFFTKGIEAFKEERYFLAIPCLEELLLLTKQHPNFNKLEIVVNTQLYLALAYQKAEMHNKAILTFKLLPASFKPDAIAYYWGVSAFYLNDFDTAQKKFNYVLSKSKNEELKKLSQEYLDKTVKENKKPKPK